MFLSSKTHLKNGLQECQQTYLFIVFSLHISLLHTHFDQLSHSLLSLWVQLFLQGRFVRRTPGCI